MGMVVFNACHTDARVLREAYALQAAGLCVRIFAIGNAKHPAGVVELENGVSIHRLPIRSAFVSFFAGLRVVYHVLRRTESLARRRAARQKAVGCGRRDLRNERAHREALDRMGRVARWKRSIRLSVAACGQEYRLGLRAAYLAIHRTAKRTLRFLHRPTQLVSFWKSAESALLEWQPAVVHAHDGNTLVPAVRAARKLNAHLIYDSHELWRHRNRGGRRALGGRLADMLIESWGVSNAAVVISVSPGIVRWLERKYGLMGRVHLLRNTPSRMFAPHAPGIRDLTGLVGGERIVLYTGRITTGRGIEEAMEAVAGLPNHVHFVMLGYGGPRYIDQLFERAHLLNMAHRFRHVGPVPHEQVAATAAQADLAIVAVQPTCLSYIHCLPNKLFEAVQAGLPVVASRLPDILDLMETHELGETFTAGSVTDLRRAIRRVLEDPIRLRHGVARASETLCWEREQLSLLSLYDTLLKPIGARQTAEKRSTGGRPCSRRWQRRPGRVAAPHAQPARNSLTRVARETGVSNIG